MRVNALVVDLALLGPGGWEFLERVAAALPGLGVVVCTGRSSVAQRVRGLRLGRRRLGHQAVSPGGGARARGGRRAPAQARVRARRHRAAAGRRAGDPRRSVPGLRELRQRGPDAPRVRGAAAARRGQGQGAAARGDLPGRLGLHDGPRRPLGRRVRAQGAPEARADVAGLELHPHALRCGLPLRSGASRRRPGRGAARGRRTRARRRARDRGRRAGSSICAPNGPTTRRSASPTSPPCPCPRRRRTRAARRFPPPAGGGGPSPPARRQGWVRRRPRAASGAPREAQAVAWGRGRPRRSRR